MAGRRVIQTKGKARAKALRWDSEETSVVGAE